MDADHITPLAAGGADDGSNIQPLTREEHNRRHRENGDFSGWGRRRR
jgi:5-methylcytosine-specific restriction endonuclease McrA